MLVLLVPPQDAALGQEVTVWLPVLSRLLRVRRSRSRKKTLGGGRMRHARSECMQQLGLFGLCVAGMMCLCVCARARDASIQPRLKSRPYTQGATYFLLWEASLGVNSTLYFLCVDFFLFWSGCGLNN